MGILANIKTSFADWKTMFHEPDVVDAENLKDKITHASNLSAAEQDMLLKTLESVDRQTEAYVQAHPVSRFGAQIQASNNQYTPKTMIKQNPKEIEKDIDDDELLH